MGNFFEDLGGVLLGTGGTKTDTTQLPTMTSEQLALYNKMLTASSADYGTPTPSYPGQSYVPTTEAEQNYFDYTSGKNPTITQQALLNVLSGKPAYEIDPNATEAYYQKSIYEPTVKTFKDTTLPQLTESFSGPGFWSSNRADQTTKAISNLNSDLSKQRSDLYYADEQARRSALESAASRRASVAPTAAQLESENLATAGQWARSIEQEKVASDLARWLSGEEINGESVSAYNPNTQLALQLLGVQPFTYAQEQTTTGKGILSSLLGGIGSGAGSAIGSNLFSKDK
jgi:hypothetical protein